MRILHYSLGFPPYRSGGLTAFCIDLMNQQNKEGHDVSLLWPGQMVGIHPRIKKHKAVNDIKSYELINPLPVPYDEGIADIDSFIVYGEKKVFIQLLEELKPEVIHIHTFMGLYSAFIDAANDLKIRTVFSTHDFFPICPKVTMYRHGKVCDSVQTCKECAQCNSTALSLMKIKMLQSTIYRVLKNTSIVKKLRKQHRDDFLSETTQEPAIVEHTKDDYLQLRTYYLAMLNKIDIIHYNSSVTLRAYEKIIKVKQYKQIPITHSAINDHRTRRQYKSDILRIRYLGPQSAVKGYFLLKKALDTLWKERKDFILDIHFVPQVFSPYLRVHEKYKYDELKDIFNETDVLVAPSIWNETFGFTVLEALSFGVPVIISGTVGARDILVEGAGVVINDISAENLLNAFNSLTPKKLAEMNKTICEKQDIMTIQNMANMIFAECYVEG